MSVFIIAEIGINHNGDIDLAKQLIDQSKKAGANAVKFQKRTLDLVYEKSELQKDRESPWGTTNRDQKQGLEFSLEEYKEIDAYCKENNICWFASAWDLESQKFLQQFDLPYNKIASAMLTHKDLLEMVAHEGRHTFISTGMSTLEEISEAVNIFRKINCPFELMHCNSSYPAKIEELNLRCLQTLARKFDCKVGYSGHETGLPTSVAAVVLGATSIERHITLDRSMYGSDQSASVEPVGFERMVRDIRAVESALGDGDKKVYSSEVPSLNKLRRTKDYEASI
ncbi:MAG: N-acetylneuraminate synthase family protein [Oligoflexales bacterium]